MYRQVQVSALRSLAAAQAHIPRGMQDCFRLHPEMYASELDEEEDEMEEELRARETAQSGESGSSEEVSHEAAKSSPPSSESKEVEHPHRDGTGSDGQSDETAGKQADELLPRAVFDSQSK